MRLSAIAVFCGSKPGNNPIYQQHAVELGEILASHHIQLIYGGENKGLMWMLANAALKHKGEVTGVIPKLLMNNNKKNIGLTRLQVVENMHERKQLFYNSCDAAVVMPGGFGTLDEMFEMLTWNQLEIHDKRIFILNSGGYYDHLIAHFTKMESENFLYGSVSGYVTLLNEPKGIVPWL